MSAPWDNASWPWSQNSLISTHIQVFDSNDKPLEGGLLYTYFSGTQEPAPVFWVGDGYGTYDWPLQLDWTGSATFYMPPAYVPYRYNVTDANGVQQDNFPIDNVLPDTLVVPYLEVGHWEGTLWVPQPCGTGQSPGPQGAENPNAFWDEYLFDSGGSMMNGAQPHYMVYGWGIKSEWIYLYLNNNGWASQPGGADASTLMGVLVGRQPVPNSLFRHPYPLMDPAPLYLALDPYTTPGSGAWFEYTLVLYLDPDYSSTAEIPFRHSLPSW